MPASPAKPRKVRCPQCGGESIWRADNKFRPFCSERCRLIDLGAWASDQYRVAGDPLDNDVLSEGDSELSGRQPNGNGLCREEANRHS